jgi:hypothetical protein
MKIGIIYDHVHAVAMVPRWYLEGSHRSLFMIMIDSVKIQRPIAHESGQPTVIGVHSAFSKLIRIDSQVLDVFNFKIRTTTSIPYRTLVSVVKQSASLLILTRSFPCITLARGCSTSRKQ